MEILFVFLFGTTVGSFVNVLIDRIPRNESVLFSRSKCEHCKKLLKWIDLIPLFSFLSLKGKCRYCHSPIPFRLFLIEFLTGILFVASYMLSSQIGVVTLVFSYFLIPLFLAIFFIDLKRGIIPDVLTGVLIVGTIMYIVSSDYTQILSHLASAGGAFLFFFLIFWLTRKKGMGLGDVKLSFFIGLLLGFPSTISAFYIAFLTGAVISLGLVFLGIKKLRGDTVPFGPFLIFGTYVSFYFGEELARIFLPGIL